MLRSMGMRWATLLLAALLIAAGLLLLLDPFPSGRPDPAATDWADSAADPAVALDNPAEANADEVAGRAERVPDPSSKPTVDRGPWGRPLPLGIPSFRGRLLLADGSPASGARVDAWGLPGQAVSFDPSDPRSRPWAHLSATTDGSGRFELPESPLGDLRYLLRADHGNALPLEITDLPIRNGSTRDLGDLRFAHGVRLAGIVLDPDGVPVDGATLEVVHESAAAALSSWLSDRAPAIPGVQFTTSRDGSFDLEGLPPGVLRVVARAPGMVETSSAPAILEDGGAVDALQVVMHRGRPLVGRVVDDSGAKITGALIEARWGSGDEASTTSDADGLFSLTLPLDPGRVQLVASASGALRARTRLRGEELDRIQELVLVPMVALPGLVVDHEGHPVAAAEIGLYEEARAQTARLTPLDSPPLFAAHSGADGRFTLDVDLARTRDSRFRLVAFAADHAPGMSSPLRLDDRADRVPTEPVEVRLGIAGRINGTVVQSDGTPLAGARVHLRRHLPARGSRDLDALLLQSHGRVVGRTTTGANGTFTLPGQSTGDYHLEAFHPGWSPGRSEEFALPEGESVEMEVILQPRSTFVGRVQGPRESFGPLRVLATASDGSRVDAVVGNDGHFEMEAMVPDHYRIELYETAGSQDLRRWGRARGASLTSPQEIELHQGEIRRLDLEIDLSLLAELTGRISENGAPAAEYRVHLMRAGYEGSDADGDKMLVRESLRTALTDHEGVYRFQGLPAEEYWVVVEGPRHRRDNLGRATLSGLMAENGPRGLARSRVALAGGEVARRDFFLRFGSLRGIAQRPSGKNGWSAVKGGLGYLRPAADLDGVSRISFTLGKDGSFRLSQIPVGSWQIELRSGEFLLKNALVKIQQGGGGREEFRLHKAPPQEGPQANRKKD